MLFLISLLTLNVHVFPDILFSSILTLFLPLRLNPYTDGFSWAKKEGYENYPSFRIAKPRETMMTKLYNFF